MFQNSAGACKNNTSNARDCFLLLISSRRLRRGQAVGPAFTEAAGAGGTRQRRLNCGTPAAPVGNTVCQTVEAKGACSPYGSQDFVGGPLADRMWRFRSTPLGQGSLENLKSTPEPAALSAHARLWSNCRPRVGGKSMRRNRQSRWQQTNASSYPWSGETVYQWLNCCS